MWLNVRNTKCKTDDYSANKLHPTFLWHYPSCTHKHNFSLNTFRKTNFYRSLWLQMTFQLLRFCHFQQTAATRTCPLKRLLEIKTCHLNNNAKTNKQLCPFGDILGFYIHVLVWLDWFKKVRQPSVEGIFIITFFILSSSSLPWGWRRISSFADQEVLTVFFCLFPQLLFCWMEAWSSSFHGFVC